MLKNKKENLLWKNVLYFGKLNFLTPILKNFSYFRKELTGLQNQKFLMYFSNITLKKNVSYTLSCKEAKFSKVKYFVIIMRHFFFFYNIFFYTQQAFVFHLQRDFCNVYNHIVAFFFFFFRKILISFTTIFCSLSLFSW